MNWLKSAWAKFVTISYFVYTKISVLFLYIIGFYYVIHLFSNLSKDTTAITNGAFAITASLSAISFSCSRAIQDSAEVKDRFTYAGERFFHAGLMLITASTLKYGYLSFKMSFKTQGDGSPERVVGIIIGSFVTILFFYALTSAHGGLIVLNKLLWSRFNRYPDWDRFF